MLGDSEHLPPKTLAIPWLGAECEALPPVVKSGLKRHFDIMEKPNNVSMLTESQIQTVIYYLNSNKYYQIDCALIICRNLNKKLIVIHHQDIDNYICDSAQVLFCIDIDAKPVNILVEQLQTHFYHQLQTQPDTTTASTADTTPNGDFERKLLDCLDYIQLNIHKPIKIETLANICHCSTYYFSRQFHDVIGMSFRNYVALKRTEIAKHLLLTQPNEKIAVIAYQTGFRDEAYFTRLFKKKVGMTPSAFRQKYLQSN